MPPYGREHTVPNAKKSTGRVRWQGFGWVFPGGYLTGQAHTASVVPAANRITDWRAPLRRFGGGDRKHKPGTWFTRRRSAKGVGDACVAPTSGPDARFRLHACLARKTAKHCENLYLIRTAPADWKGPGKPPGTPPSRIPAPVARALRGVQICIFIRTDHPREEHMHHRLVGTSSALWQRGPQAQTGNMVCTPAFRSW